MSCACESCIKIRNWLDRGIPEDVVSLIIDLSDSNNYYEAIFDGSWPSGKELLTKALEKYE